MPDAGAVVDAGVPDAGPADAGLVNVHLALALHRSDAGLPNPIIAVVTALDDTGAPVGGLDVRIEVAGLSTQANAFDGGYAATIVPSIVSGELPISARVAGSDAGVSRTALVLPFLSPWWDQPESLAEPVNTAGTEDSSTVSPDGQWLVVGDYSPVDLLCCFSGCGGWESLDGTSPFCSTPIGPLGAPDRPRLPGAERVTASGIQDDDPTLCVAGADGGEVLVPGKDGGVHPFALPPVASYLFHRQADGEFADPHVIDVGSDGFLAGPSTFTFLGTADAGDSVSVIFAYQQYPTDAKPHPWFGQLTMGQDNQVSRYACAPGATMASFTPLAMAPLPVGPVGQQAINTSVAATPAGVFLLSDDESAIPPYVEWSRALADGGFTDWQTMALPDPTADRRQPLYIGGRLYYYRDGAVVSVAWNGNDPTDPNSFSTLVVEAAGGTPTGAAGEVVGMGQPTFAQPPGGQLEMYFVYYRRTSTGLDGQIARVPLR